MIKKKKRKNPKLEEIALTKREISYLTDDLSNAIVYASPFFLTGAITLLNIGEKCKDCGEEYHLCECEKCDDCNQKRCLCNVKSIREEAWKLSKELFNKLDLNKFKQDILNWLDDDINPPNITNNDYYIIKKILK